MSQQSEALKKRTMRFALDVCALLQDLPCDEPGPTVKRQLAKAATGVAFNYRASCRARSHAEFTSKIGIVSEDVDETQGWLEFIVAGCLAPRPPLALLEEAIELTKIISAQVGTARENERKRKQKD